MAPADAASAGVSPLDGEVDRPQGQDRDATESSPTATAACRTHRNGVRRLTSQSSPYKIVERKENHKEERQAEELKLVVWVSTQPKRNHSAFLLTVIPCIELWS